MKKTIKKTNIKSNNYFEVKKIMDGRNRKYGKKIKKITKVLYPIMVILMSISLTVHIVNFFTI